MLPLLFSDANELNLRLILKDLPILTKVEEIIIIYIYIFIYRLYIYAASNINILAISAALAKTHQRLRNSYCDCLRSLIYSL